MSHPADHSHSVRKVVLPSGETIEVVYFEDDLVSGLTGAPATRKRRRGGKKGLHQCASCACALVYPVEWSEVGTTHWEITLRCPNCEWTDTGVFTSAAAEHFDGELDRGTELMLSDLRHLTRANMEHDVARFAAALQHGHILPEDF